ncbi:MAG: Dipeptide transport system permease protein DppC [Chloroflexi bacterium ADurb.Bin325]|nr:MAG: Dipeptide transport system permease protein DppC [Chloroflexi bacterium ADurb.Bin325]
MAVTTLSGNLLSRRPSLLLKAWRRLLRDRAGIISLVMILLTLLIALLAPLLAPHDPLVGDFASVLQMPSSKYWFGTDELGRDVLSRILYGARVSMAVGLLSQIAVVIVGIPIGAVAGLRGGWVDYMLMRIIDVMSALPSLLFYILLMIALGRGLFNIVLAMSITGWIGIARLVRGQVLSLKATDYVRAATAMGAGSGWIIAKHLIRNSLSPVFVSVTLGVPGAIFAEAGLSLLGLGIPPPNPSWGQMIGEGSRYFRTHPHLILYPSIALTFTILFWMLLGEALQKALDPTGS